MNTHTNNNTDDDNDTRIVQNVRLGRGAKASNFTNSVGGSLPAAAAGGRPTTTSTRPMLLNTRLVGLKDLIPLQIQVMEKGDNQYNLLSFDEFEAFGGYQTVALLSLRISYDVPTKCHYIEFVDERQGEAQIIIPFNNKTSVKFIASVTRPKGSICLDCNQGTFLGVEVQSDRRFKLSAPKEEGPEDTGYSGILIKEAFTRLMVVIQANQDEGLYESDADRVVNKLQKLGITEEGVDEASVKVLGALTDLFDAVCSDGVNVRALAKKFLGKVGITTGILFKFHEVVSALPEQKLKKFFPQKKLIETRKLRAWKSPGCDLPQHPTKPDRLVLLFKSYLIEKKFIFDEYLFNDGVYQTTEDEEEDDDDEEEEM